ncbi:MAG TPA: cyclic 2,3-diphosphoglycerate synthase [Xanthobacteraceae bacterium]|nr:cyclic 2,3-diphosphoglycerate synthase [Xanthobacteraceae bacterium]
MMAQNSRAKASEGMPSARARNETGRRRVIIVGAAGRDFHNFNVIYRNDSSVEVIAFTAAQIPGIARRRYPASLAGALYPNGIPIADEAELDALCRTKSIDEVIFAYSDVPHEHVMHIASRALAAGADFALLGPRRTMLNSARPVIAITAVRTGCGKSAVARWLSQRLRQRGLRVAVLRHPMPYGDLEKEHIQRFASAADLDAAQCTAEEREEYEPHIAAGNVVFAGVDYADILKAAEGEADIVVWDGGNNDFPFIKPNLHITIVDALRPRQIATHHPGETVARMADVFVINKVDSAAPSDIRLAEEGLRMVNRGAVIVRGASPIRLEDSAAVKGKRAIVVDDGPTITHGGMAYGAGYLAAVAAEADVVDPRLSATPEISEVFQKYPHIGKVLPAVGYNRAQLAALEATINNSRADVIISATPVDFAHLLHLNKRVVRVRYEFAEVGEPKLSSIIDGFVARIAHARSVR